MNAPISTNSAAFRAQIARAVRDAITRYGDMSGDAPWSTPESWVQCAVASDLASHLADHFYVWLESPPKPIDRGVHVDISLHDKSDSPEAVALIEVKKYDIRAKCDRDADRLTKLAKKYHTVESALIVAYLYQPNADKLRVMVDQLQVDLAAFKIPQDRIEKEFFKDNLCAVIVAELVRPS